MLNDPAPVSLSRAPSANRRKRGLTETMTSDSGTSALSSELLVAVTSELTAMSSCTRSAKLRVPRKADKTVADSGKIRHAPRLRCTRCTDRLAAGLCVSSLADVPVAAIVAANLGAACLVQHG